MTTVTILYKSLPAYRLEFFDRLRVALADRGVSLRLIHGDAIGSDAAKRDTTTLAWAERRPNKTLRVGQSTVVWQPALGAAIRSDLVIVEQANKLLINYALVALSRFARGPRLALWGHGANLQAGSASSLRERFKRRYSRLPHWWFAYTQGSKDRVIALGFPEDRITVVNNAIDTTGLRMAVETIGTAAVDAFRRTYELTPGRTALFLGSLYPEKRLEFLIAAAQDAHDIDPMFRLVIAGDGPSRDELSVAAGTTGFIHLLGRVDGADRATALAAADVMLMPGLVGLGVLDAFAAGIPLATTAIPIHSPEIEYLSHGENGLILPEDITSGEYAAEIVHLMHDPERLAQMSRACLDASSRYSTQHMVERFAQGVMRALE